MCELQQTRGESAPRLMYDMRPVNLLQLPELLIPVMLSSTKRSSLDQQRTPSSQARGKFALSTLCRSWLRCCMHANAQLFVPVASDSREPLDELHWAPAKLREAGMCAVRIRKFK